MSETKSAIRHGWCAAAFDVLRAGRPSQAGRRDPVWMAHKHHSSSLPRRSDQSLYPLWHTDPNTIGTHVSPVLGIWFSQLQYMLVVVLAMAVTTSPVLIYLTVVNENDFGKDNLGGFNLFGGENSTQGKVDFLAMTTVFPRMYLQGAEYQFIRNAINNSSSAIDNLIKQLRRPQPGASNVAVEVIWNIWLSWIVLWCFLFYLSQRMKLWGAVYDGGTDESNFSVVVDGIPPDATAHDISKFFEQWGQVARVTRIGLIDPMLPKLHDRKRRLLENIGELEWVERSHNSRRGSPASSPRASAAAGALAMGLRSSITPAKPKPRTMSKSFHALEQERAAFAGPRPRTSTVEGRKRHVSHIARQEYETARSNSGYGSVLVPGGGSGRRSPLSDGDEEGEQNPAAASSLSPSGISSLNLSDMGHSPSFVGNELEENNVIDSVAARAFRITESEGGVLQLEEHLVRTRKKLEETQRRIAERIAFAGQKMIQHTLASSYSHSNAAAARAARADGISGVVFVSFVETTAAKLCLQAWDPLLQQPNTVDAALRQIAFGFAAGLGWKKPPGFPPPAKPSSLIGSKSRSGGRRGKKQKKSRGGDAASGGSGRRSSGERNTRTRSGDEAIADARRRAAWQWFRSDRENVRANSTEISVKRAPRISDIRWGNLTVSPWSKIRGSCCSAVLVVLAVAVALGIQIIYVWSSVLSLSCTNPDGVTVGGYDVCTVIYKIGLQVNPRTDAGKGDPCITGGTSCNVTSSASIWNWLLTCLLGVSRWFITVLVVPYTNRISRLYQYRDQEQRAHFRISAVLEVGYFMLSLLLFFVQVEILAADNDYLMYPMAQNFSEFWFRLILLDALGQIWGHFIRPQMCLKRVWAVKNAKTQADLNRQWRDRPVRPFLLYRQMLRVVTVPLLIGSWSPLIYWVALLEGLIFYSVQKYSILRHRAKPPKIGVRLATEMMRVLWIICGLSFVTNCMLSLSLQEGGYWVFPTGVATLCIGVLWCALWLLSKDDVRRNLARALRWVSAHMSCCACLFPARCWWWCYSNVAEPTEAALLVENADNPGSTSFESTAYEPYEPPWNANIGGFTVDFVGGTHGDASPGRVHPTPP